mmetsp:Transcript_86526/g.231138  ORF Transcript_86526/g.231138 Transcript_86526/m.231138 type:complete len:244 (+) Transcript_86526:370-1101(+)
MQRQLGRGQPRGRHPLGRRLHRDVPQRRQRQLDPVQRGEPHARRHGWRHPLQGQHGRGQLDGRGAPIRQPVRGQPAGRRAAQRPPQLGADPPDRPHGCQPHGGAGRGREPAGRGAELRGHEPGELRRGELHRGGPARVQDVLRGPFVVTDVPGGPHQGGPARRQPVPRRPVRVQPGGGGPDGRRAGRRQSRGVCPRGVRCAHAGLGGGSGAHSHRRIAVCRSPAWGGGLLRSIMDRPKTLYLF